MKSLLKKLFAASLLAGCLAPLAVFAQIAEPSTVFYGQVINRTSAQTDLITQGNLVWTILQPGGKTLTLTAALKPLNNGRFSYRLAVPHEALTFGLTVSDTVIPLAAAAADCSHLVITVDGAPASILAPGPAYFTVSQNLRAATYRLDLELTSPLADTSGDGIPDWWKTLYGITDPNAVGADGWSNLQKFRNGGNPAQDNRFPTLATTEFWVYADGITEVPLTAVDSDSAATGIQYTLTSLPAGGTFYLHNVNTNGGINDVALGINGTFSQDDVNQGRLVFVQNQTNAPAAPMTFNMNLGDENPAHATNYVITLNVFRPNYPDAVDALAETNAAAPVGCPDLPGFAFGEQQMLLNYYLSRDHGYILADTSRATMSHTVKAASAGASAGLDHSYVLTGGAGDDRLVGGTTNDIIIGGRGKDVMRGNGGADLFIIPGTDSGNETIEDFKVAEGDVLDISRLLQGASTQLTNYVQLTTAGTNSLLGINFAGAGAGYSNLTVTLLGTQLTSTNLRSLVDGGSLLTGSKGMSPVVSIVASIPAASQNDLAPGQFTLTRSGPLGSALTVNLTISGSAVNGSSYELIASTATFSSGQRNLTLPVNPYLNSATVSTVAQISVAAGGGYEIGSPASAQVSIEPLLPQITIEAIEPEAVRSDLTPGTFLVSRAGIFDRSVLVRLTIGGTASTSTDYTAVSTVLNFPPYQTTALVSIAPKTTANVTNGTKFVQIAIKADPSYKVMNPSVDRVFIVDQLFSHDSWQARYFPGSGESWASFANLDAGNAGIKNLYRYAYGLNAVNPVATNGIPFYQILNGHLSVTFRRPLAVTDLDYIVQVSDDLIHWSSLADDVEAFTPAAANTNDVESVSFRSKAVVTGTPKQFMRVLLQPR
ncbi:MAG TPA: type I secretion C-terminal target domain-containing protein [Verrucomicrobiae bacterium]|nr:type I secretion C-terminal target domain-containing protein [Verrucomicrobiae bacterium]